MPMCDKEIEASSDELSSQLDVAEPCLKPLLVPQHSGEGTLAQRPWEVLTTLFHAMVDRNLTILDDESSSKQHLTSLETAWDNIVSVPVFYFLCFLKDFEAAEERRMCQWRGCIRRVNILYYLHDNKPVPVQDMQFSIFQSFKQFERLCLVSRTAGVQLSIVQTIRAIA